MCVHCVHQHRVCLYRHTFSWFSWSVCFLTQLVFYVLESKREIIGTREGLCPFRCRLCPDDTLRLDVEGYVQPFYFERLVLFPSLSSALPPHPHISLLPSLPLSFLLIHLFRLIISFPCLSPPRVLCPYRPLPSYLPLLPICPVSL